jgi:hypothetical protein
MINFSMQLLSFYQECFDLDIIAWSVSALLNYFSSQYYKH